MRTIRQTSIRRQLSYFLHIPRNFALGLDISCLIRAGGCASLFIYQEESRTWVENSSSCAFIYSYFGTFDRVANMALAAIFGRRKTPEEVMREQQRLLNRTIRELDRERSKLEQQEKKIIADIKKMAKQGQMDAVKIMAKDLVRTRAFVKKFILMKANIQAVSLKIQTLRSTAAMANAMKGVTKAMARMNSKMNLPQMQKIMMEFEKQSEIMDMKEEMMNDTMDDVIGGEDEDEESEQVVQQVFDELGLVFDDELTGLPVAKNAVGAQASAGAAKEPVALDADSDLQSRLDNLRRE